MQQRKIHYQLEPLYDTTLVKSCLLIEACAPIRLDLELVLRRYFEQNLKRLFIAPDQTEPCSVVLDGNYDVVVLNGIAPSCLRLPDSINTTATTKPLMIALVEDPNVYHAHPLIDYFLPSDTNALQFEVHLEELLEVHTVLNHYPWLRINENIGKPLALLHRSEGAVLFRVAADTGDQVVKYFKLDTHLLAPHHFQVFLALVEKLKSLQHAGVVNIIKVEATTEGVYVVMEYVEGTTLKDWLWDDPLPPLSQRLQWYRGVVEAVGVLHQAGIVHGDLKSSNIMIRDNDQPVLLDFGLDGQLLREAGALGEGEIYGTPYYVSPELIMGDPLDHQADIYALGVLFYELLTGQKPYQATSLDLILRKHMLAPIPTLPEHLHVFQPLLKHLMAKIPESRVPSAQYLLQALDELALQGIA